VIDQRWLTRRARLLERQGALAVVLTGSVARGNAQPESDIDLIALGDGPEYRLSHEAGRLLSVSWQQPLDVLAAFVDPGQAGYVVPGWRNAVALRDQTRAAQTLIEAAQAWTWDRIGDARRTAWVAEELSGYAEEVHKLAGAMTRHAATTAAIQRNVLAMRLAPIMAVHLRLLYDSENDLWDLVAAELGEPWRSVQAQALGLEGASNVESCQAALLLFALACRAAYEHFDDRQRAVIEHALALVERRMGTPR
jgi:predicted nucleotidyltransferase